MNFTLIINPVIDLFSITITVDSLIKLSFFVFLLKYQLKIYFNAKKQQTNLLNRFLS